MRLATRGSPLARWQAELVAETVGGATLVLVETLGDRRRDVSLTEIGGQGVFVKEVQAAVLAGDGDAAVHSAKDLPSQPTEGLVIGAVLERGDPRDALVGCALAALPRGASVATGSVRRRVQLAHLRPDLVFADLRGNMDTRLAKAASFDAIVVAAAALQRLGRDDEITEILDSTTVVPQVGQGTIAVECRADDDATRARLAAIDHPASRWALEAERAFLATLGGGCTLPVGAYATADDGILAVIASADGGDIIRHRAHGDDAAALGRGAAEHMLAVGGAAFLGGT